MSKSLGNVTDPSDLVTEFGVDPVRYFLLRDGGIENDADFSKASVKKRYKELAGQLGNLVMRCSAEKVNRKLIIPTKPSPMQYTSDETKLVHLLENISGLII